LVYFHFGIYFFLYFSSTSFFLIFQNNARASAKCTDPGASLLNEEGVAVMERAFADDADEDLQSLLASMRRWTAWLFVVFVFVFGLLNLCLFLFVGELTLFDCSRGFASLLTCVEAEEKFSDAVKVSGGYHRAYANLALVKFAQGKEDLAVDYISKV
jgi:hypothetical protein